VAFRCPSQFSSIQSAKVPERPSAKVAFHSCRLHLLLFSSVALALVHLTHWPDGHHIRLLLIMKTFVAFSLVAPQLLQLAFAFSSHGHGHLARGHAQNHVPRNLTESPKLIRRNTGYSPPCVSFCIVSFDEIAIRSDASPLSDSNPEHHPRTVPSGGARPLQRTDS
jgi:hypothetical protein